jgi:dienelactone hydrolase
MWRVWFAALIVAVLAPTISTARAGELQNAVPGPQGLQNGDTRRQIWLIPLPGERLLMRAIVLRPRGENPFPLVVINHGSSQSTFQRATFVQPTYRILSQWFLDHGYVVVLPLRPGHGATGGPYFEDQGRCDNADYEKAGLATAYSIQAAIDYMTAQPFVRKAGVVVAGHSAGGWGVLALASRNPTMVRAVINFAGGRGGHADDKPYHNCVPDRLIAAARSFGRTARIPTLWLYAENDTYFAPALSKRMASEFRSAGGHVEYHLLPAVGADGHAFIKSKDAVALWAPLVKKFLTLKH